MFTLLIGFAPDLTFTSGLTAAGGYSPIPEIARDDAELSIFFLAQNKLAYTHPVDDLFFASHSNPTPHEVVPGDIDILYYNDKLVSVMGCIDQHQICKPNFLHGPKCTPLGSSTIPQSEIDKLDFNQLQKHISYVIRMLILEGEILNSIAGQGAIVLKAQKTVFNNINGPLSNNQWTIEAGSWFNTALAQFQHAILEYSTGPEYTDNGRYQHVNIASMKRIYKDTCGIQKVRQFNFNDSYLSFSVLGLTVIFVIGGVIIILGLVLESQLWKLQEQIHPPQRGVMPEQECSLLGAGPGVPGQGHEMQGLPPRNEIPEQDRAEQTTIAVDIHQPQPGSGGTDPPQLVPQVRPSPIPTMSRSPVDRDETSTQVEPGTAPSQNGGPGQNEIHGRG